MNGRALNGKAIEISPSSSKVLNHAAEILTPFPPSKNHPQPGDWTCLSCRFSNFQRHTDCFRYSFPGPYRYGYGPPHMMPPQQMGHRGGMYGGRMRGRGGEVPLRTGDWKCGSEMCGYHNFAKNISCLRCGSSTAGAVAVANTWHPYPSLNTQFGPTDPFESRALEASFQSATNGLVSTEPGNFYPNQSESDPFAFLSSGISGLNIGNQDTHQNGVSADIKNHQPNLFTFLWV